MPDNAEYKTITLPRTGESPVRFQGRQIAEAAEPLPPFKKARTDSRRWHELRLFQHQDGRFIVSIGFRTGMETEINRDLVFIFSDNGAEVIDFLSRKSDDSYDPLEYLEGFPDDPRFDSRQEMLETRVSDDYENRVTLLLGGAGFVEEI